MASQKPQVVPRMPQAVPKMPPVASQTPHVAYQLWPPRTLNLSLRLPKLPLSPKEHPLLPCRCLMWPPRWLKWPYRRPKLPFRHQANCLRDFPFGVPKLSLGHPKWPFLPLSCSIYTIVTCFCSKGYTGAQADIPVNLNGSQDYTMVYQKVLVATKTSQKVTLLSQIDLNLTLLAFFTYLTALWTPYVA